MKKIDVEETILDILNQEGQEEGIQQIRDILNAISKGRRKKKIRVNSYDSIAVKVYELRQYQNYSRIRAIEKIATDESIAESTVNNHLIKFDKKANEDDYMNFGYWTYTNYISTSENYYEAYEESDAIKCGKLYNLTKNESVGYYLKYKLQIKRKDNNFKPDESSKYTIPF